MTARWIIGRGLLGRAVARAHGDVDFAPHIPWANPDAAVTAISAGLAKFARADTDLEIYWTAGRGVTSTSAADLDVEIDVFRRAVAAVAALPSDRRARLTFFLASSVGGAYAGSGAPPFTEDTPAVPSSDYGRAKLEMEALLADATARGGWRSFVGRITNIYGAGQDLSKAQGLISALVRSHLSGQPIAVYVPLDTLRDYIYEDDCSAVVVAGMERVRTSAPGTTVVKIIGTMRAVSIGALLAELTRLRRRRGPIVLGGGDPRGQSLDLRVKSIVWTDLDGLVRTTLPEGLSRVYQAQLSGRLNPR